MGLRVSGSTLSDVLAALATLFTTANVTGLQVTDGPNFDPSATASMMLEVGWAGEAADAVAVARVPTDMSGRRFTETMTIRCLMSNHDGTIGVPATRAVLAATFDTLDTALHALPGNQILNVSGVITVQVTEYGYAPARTVEGSDAAFGFTITVAAAK